MSLIKCPKCGIEISDKAAFCPSCGFEVNSVKKYPECEDCHKKNNVVCSECRSPLESPENEQNIAKDEKQEKTKVVLIIVSVLAAVMAVILAVMLILNSGKGTKSEGAGFKSPDEVITAYVTALKKGDLKEIMSTYAVESYVENYDMEKYTERMAVFMPSSDFFPMNGEYEKQLNTEKRRADITNNLRYQYLALIGSELTDLKIKPLEGDSSLFINKLFPLNSQDVMPSIELIGVVEPEEVLESYSAEQNKKLFDRTRDYLGADGYETIAALISANDKTFILCMDTVQYGDKWYVCSLTGNIGDLLGMPRGNGGIMELPSGIEPDDLHELF